MTNLQTCLLLLAIGLMSACSTPIKVSTDYDKAANFSAFKTFQFTDRSMDLPVSQLNRDRLIRAVEASLAAKGLAKSDNPDLVCAGMRTGIRQTEPAGY